MPSPDRRAKNEALFREINERIDAVSADVGLAPDERVRFVCECSDVDCTEWLDLALDEYEAIRRDATHFVVTPGHERDALERVVKRTERYVVVDKKFDQRFFEATDPRP
jgi:hypothetical protein